MESDRFIVNNKNKTPNVNTEMENYKFKKSKKPYATVNVDQFGYTTNQSSSINFFVCVLCVICVTLSVYILYRENLLESRVKYLEDQLQQRILTSSSILSDGKEKENNDDQVLIQRLRREVESQFQQRVHREIASSRRMLMEAEQRLHRRIAREAQLPSPTAAECACPPGIYFRFIVIGILLHRFQLKKTLLNCKYFFLYKQLWMFINQKYN